MNNRQILPPPVYWWHLFVSLAITKKPKGISPVQVPLFSLQAPAPLCKKKERPLSKRMWPSIDGSGDREPLPHFSWKKEPLTLGTAVGMPHFVGLVPEVGRSFDRLPHTQCGEGFLRRSRPHAVGLTLRCRASIAKKRPSGGDRGASTCMPRTANFAYGDLSAGHSKLHTSGKRIRKGTNSYLIPDFVEIQRKSFFELLEKGLIEEFSKRNPITNKNLEIFFYPEYYQLTPPEYNPRRAILVSKSYSSKLFIPAQLTDKKQKKSQLRWVLIGHLPLMTKRGHFVLNGAPRVIVNQILRSPGIYFQGSLKEIFSDPWSEKAEVKYKRFYTDLICLRGTWLRIEIDKNRDIWAQMKKVPPIPLFWFLLAMGLTERIIFKSIINPTRLLANFQPSGIKSKMNYEYVTNPIDAWKQISRLIASSALSPNTSPLTGESPNNTRPSIAGRSPSIAGASSGDRGPLEAYQKQKKLSPSKRGLVSFLNIVEHSKEGRNWIFKRFMNPRAYDLGNQGRLNFNRKLGLTISSTQTTLTAQDLLFATDYLLKVEKGLKNIDDIDHLKNRRVRTSGELLQIQIGVGLVRLEQNIREKLAKINAQTRASEFLTSSPSIAQRWTWGDRGPNPLGGHTPQCGVNKKKPFLAEIQNNQPFLRRSRGQSALNFNKKKAPPLPSRVLSPRREGKATEALLAPKAVNITYSLSGTKAVNVAYSLSGINPLYGVDQKIQPSRRNPKTIVVRKKKGTSLPHVARKKTRDSFNQARNSPVTQGGVPIEKFIMTNLINTKAFNGALREFFGTSQLSQFMDQLNPLAEITHKRRLSSMGPGGVTRDSATLAIRGIHPTHYGRICPIETPEGKNTGLVNSLTTYARANPQGFLESPFYKVYKGQIQKNAGMYFLSAEQEENVKVAAADVANPSGRIEFLPKYKIPAKVAYGDTISKISRNVVEYVGVSPIQMISIATSLIPFLEHDDANRALMGSNMQRQAVPLVRAERPLVGTGLESRTVSDSGHAVIAKQGGYVAYVSATKIVIYTI